MSGLVDIRGTGLTALACTAMAHHAGIAVHRHDHTGSTSTELPYAAGDDRVIVLNSVSVSLLDDVFPGAEASTLGAAATGRTVRWGGARPRRVNEPLRVVRTGDLLATLKRLVDATSTSPMRPDPSDVTVVHTRRSSVDRVSVGQRCMISVEAEIVGDPLSECLVESVPDGWLFVAPLGDGKAIVQAMTPDETTAKDGLDPLLRASELISPRVRVITEPEVAAAAPSIGSQMTGEHWIRAGGGFVGFDPISGEGSALTLRCCVLLFAALQSVSNGTIGAEDALDHVEWRIRRTFAAHLTACARLYDEAFDHRPAWRDELVALEHAATRLAPADVEPRFELNGFILRCVNADLVG